LPVCEYSQPRKPSALRSLHTRSYPTLNLCRIEPPVAGYLETGQFAALGHLIDGRQMDLKQLRHLPAVSFAPDGPVSRSRLFSASSSAFVTAINFTSWLVAPTVFFPRQRPSGTVLRNPTSGCFFIQKVELENADVNSSPFGIVRGSSEISSTN
jgi:hypothetical protein